MNAETHPAIAVKLTKPQQRLLLAVANRPDSARRGHSAKGSQWPAIRRLRGLGLLYVEEYVYMFNRDNIYLRPTEKGREWADALRARAAAEQAS